MLFFSVFLWFSSFSQYSSITVAVTVSLIHIIVLIITGSHTLNHFVNEQIAGNLFGGLRETKQKYAFNKLVEIELVKLINDFWCECPLSCEAST